MYVSWLCKRGYVDCCARGATSQRRHAVAVREENFPGSYLLWCRRTISLAAFCIVALAGPAHAADQLSANRLDIAEVKVATAPAAVPAATASSVRSHTVASAVMPPEATGAPAQPAGIGTGKSTAEPRLSNGSSAPLAIESGGEQVAGVSFTAGELLDETGTDDSARGADLYWLMLVVATLTLGSFAVASGRFPGRAAVAASSWRGIIGWAGNQARLLWFGRDGAAMDRVSASALTALRADLHDGPAQHLAYALMHLDQIEPADTPDNDARREAYRKIELAIRSALVETREIASGSSLPAIQRLDPATVIADAINSHESRTHTSVQRQITGLPPALAPSVKVCLYRFAQEGLNNAYRHGHGKGQKLTVKLAGNEIFAEVADEGPGSADADAKPGRMGLSGLRQRAEAAGGKLEVVSLPGKGTKLVLRLPAPKRVDSD